MNRKNKSYLFFSLPLIAVLLMNVVCEKSKNPFVPTPSGNRCFTLGDTLTLSYREIAENTQSRISIEFDSVLEDSRCPEGLMCFWEGNARLSFLFKEPDGRHRFALNTYSGFTRDTLISDYRISLIAVLPHRQNGQEVDQKDYMAVIKIE
jgi:hypothetical protein